MEQMAGVLPGAALYGMICLGIAGVRAAFCRRERGVFRRTFRLFFREALNPFHWFWN